MKPKLLILILLIFCAIFVYGQTGSCSKTTEGTDFWFGFMEGRNYNTGHYVEVTLTSSYSCNYQIFIGKSVTASFTGSVSPNIPVKVKIDWKLVEATGSESIQLKGIHLVSDRPLNVYALNWSPNSSEVALIFPVKALGNEYYAMCYTPHINGNGINTGSGRNSEFLIVASEDNTIVNITPSKVTDKGKPANVTFAINLSKGELYQVQSENLPTPKYPGQGDLTGSYIISNKPVALYSGSLSTTVPYGASVSAWDHLYEQIPPVQTWGRKFITVPLKTRHEDTYRILASADNTTIRFSNKSMVMNKGQMYEFSLLYTEPTLIESDKPILLAQFSNSQSVDSKFTGKDGDPFMVIVSSVTQTREKVAFVAYDSPEITNKYFINVVVKDDVVGKIMLDNKVVSFVSLSGSGYSYAQIPLVKGNHYIESTETGKGFIAYVYGFGGVEAYGYGVGYNLDVVLDLGSNINFPDEKLLVRCDGAPALTLNAGNGFDNYLWSTGATTSTISVSDEGTYSVTGSTADGCKLTDVIKLVVSKPVVNLGTDLTICNSDTAVLDAGDLFTNFVWSTYQISQKISVTKAGTYSVQVTDKYGCKALDDIKVSVAEKPTIDLSSLEKVICNDTKTTLVNIKTNALSYVLESVDKKATVSELNVSVPDYGIYPMVFKATGTNCTTVQNFNLTFNKPPVLDLGHDTTICNPGNLELNAGNKFARYLWSTKDTVPKIKVTKEGMYTVKITDKSGCKTSDSIKVAFEEKPKIDLSGIDTLNCGSLSTTLDVSADKKVTWLLESSSTKVYIKDLMAEVSPVDVGTYPFVLTAKDEFSCFSKATFNLTFHETPKLDLGRDTTICGTDSIKLFAGDRFASYLWSTNARTKSIIVKKEGTYRVSVVDSNGCKTSDEIKITFGNKPKLDFSKLDTSFCGKFVTTLNITADRKVKWLLNSSNPKVKINGLTVSVSPGDFGTYPISLNASDGLSCSVDTIIRLGFYVVPTLALGQAGTICGRDNMKLDAGNQFASYLWSTKDTTQSIIVGKSGIYRVNVIDKNGCKASDSIKVAFGDKPILNLSKLDTLFCGKKVADLNVKSDKGNITIQRISDGFVFKDSTVSVPDFGTYDFKIKVTDELGCYSDSLIKIGFHKTPVVDLSVDSTQCFQYNLNVRYLGDADVNASDFIWIFGGDTIKHGIAVDSCFIPLGIDRTSRDLKLIVTDQGCSNDKTLRDIKVSPNLKMWISDSLGCQPFTAKFNASNTEKVTYDWDFGDGEFLSGSTADPSHTYQNEGYYPVKLQITTIEGCTNEVKVDSMVYVAPVPTVKFSLLPDDCLDPGVNELYYTGSGNNRDKYNWDLTAFGPAEIISDPKQTQGPLKFDLKAKPAATVGLKVISEFGCNSLPGSVVLKRKPDFTINSSLNAGCPPLEPLFSAKVLDPVDQVKFSWDFGDGTKGGGDQIKHVYGVMDHKYDVVLTAHSETTGCSDTLSRKKFVWTYPIPTAGFSSLPAKCLEKGNHEISYKGTGDRLDTYLWDLTQMDNDEIIQNPISTQGPLIFNLKNKPQASIGLRVISKYGCKSDSVSLFLKRKPDFTIDSSSNAGCAPLESVFIVKTNDPVDQVNYSWNFGDGTFGKGEQVKHEYAEPDHKYDLSLNAFSSTTGCADTLIRKAFVSVYPKPEAKFKMDNKIVYNDKPTVNFANLSTGANTWLWNFGDGLTSDLKNPSHYYKVTGHRTVLLEVSNDFLCADTVSHQLLIAFYRIYPPNAFSPNAPNAVDREYKLVADGVAAEGYHFTIINRWNDIVFETRDEIKGWDGRMLDGTLAPVSTYVWILDFVDFLGRQHHQSGTVTIVY